MDGNRCSQGAPMLSFVPALLNRPLRQAVSKGAAQARIIKITSGIAQRDRTSIYLTAVIRCGYRERNMYETCKDTHAKNIQPFDYLSWPMFHESAYSRLFCHAFKSGI